MQEQKLGCTPTITELVVIHEAMDGPPIVNYLSNIISSILVRHEKEE